MRSLFFAFGAEFHAAGIKHLKNRVILRHVRNQLAPKLVTRLAADNADTKKCPCGNIKNKKLFQLFENSPARERRRHRKTSIFPRERKGEFQ